MALPLILLGGLSVLGGIGGHLSAKEKNEQAQQIADEAKRLYDNARNSLKGAQERTQDSLLALGTTKKQVLDTSIAQFMIAYNRVKEAELSNPGEIDELKNFMIDEQGILQLKEMSDIYESALSSGAAGAATGALVALAASGALSTVTGTLSIAGSLLTVGEFSMAAGVAGSAVSLGAAATPFAAIAAPVVLFSGISADMKADENIEKAKTMYAEAEAAAEKMKTSEVLCDAISEKAKMFNDLLLELDKRFSYCTALLDGVTKKRMGFFSRKVNAKKLTDEEKKLLAITRALAGAVKNVISTPILTDNGEITSESQDLYESTNAQLLAISESVSEIENTDYHVKAITAKPKPKTKHGNVREKARNVTFKTFNIIKKICCFAAIGIFCAALYVTSSEIVGMNYYVISSVITAVILKVLLTKCASERKSNMNLMQRCFVILLRCIFVFPIAILLYALLNKFFGISHMISVIAAVAFYALFTYKSVFAED